MKYTAQLGSSAATVGVRPRYRPTAPSSLTIDRRLWTVLTYASPPARSVLTCSRVFRTSRGHTMVAATAPAYA